MPTAELSLVSMVLTFICMLGIAAGQILFRISAQRIDAHHLLSSTLLNLPLWIALAVYGLATLLWIHVLRTAPLNRVYPVFALAFLVVPVLETLVLGTPLRRQSLIGGAVIMVGVWIAVQGTEA